MSKAKENDDLVPHYRLAITKVKAQSQSLKEKLESSGNEVAALKQETVHMEQLEMLISRKI